MTILDLLDRPIAYHRVFVELTHSVKAAVLLSQAVYWQKRANQKDGYWYKSAEEWLDETGLTRHEQETARRDCGEYLLSDLRGVPATLYWKVNEPVLSKALIQFSGKRETGLAKRGKQVSPEPSNINKNPETTPETTPRGGLSEAEKLQANKLVDAIIENGRKVKYTNRDKIPEPYLELADTYFELTGQEPLKVVLHEWLQELSVWQAANIRPSHIRDAYKHASRDGGFFVASPRSLTKTALAFKGKDKVSSSKADDGLTHNQRVLKKLQDQFERSATNG